MAGIHEYGCTIRAKKSRFLTVPIHPDSVGKKARSFSDLFVFTAASGEKFLAKNVNNDLVLYYWLTPSVTIPERSFLRTGHDENAERIIEQTERAIGQVLIGKMSVDDIQTIYGQQMATAIKKKIRDISTPPNSSATILAKGSSNPLVDTEGLINSIMWKRE